MEPDNTLLDALSAASFRVEPTLVVAGADAIIWDEDCDVLVVGMRMAGASACLRAAEDQNLSIIAIDRRLGGGASKLSGGVVYMGGGTCTQTAAGVEDSPENIANYLAFETRDVVRPATLARFAKASTTFEPWHERHGVRLGGPVTHDKTSYPDNASLYFSGNETTPARRAMATPAQRGHRAKPPYGGEPTKLSGAYLMPPFIAAIDRQPNIRFFRQTRARRMIVDHAGAVIGLEVARVAPGLAARDSRVP